MEEKEILLLVNDFRRRIDKAYKKGSFKNTSFEDFPTQCCGIASRLLAKFLDSYGVKTIFISAEEFDTTETHAWLVINDGRIGAPRNCFHDVPDDIIALMGSYNNQSYDEIRCATRYFKEDLEYGLIVDITGDQFGEESTYVGQMDEFHQRFEFINAHEYDGIYDSELYEIVLRS